MGKPLTCHLLIGPPASGKSTLAAQMQQHFPNAVIISTDTLREQLFGDAATQGRWELLAANVHERIHSAIAQGQTVIYDATNARRCWRLDLLHNLQLPANVSWVGWHLTTPLTTCLAWNQRRDRRVPPAVIEALYAALKNFPPLEAEGVCAVYSLDPSRHDRPIRVVQQRLANLRRSLVNRANRNTVITGHSYSDLRDFDRLLHLIALMIKYPGIGNLQAQQPELLRSILGESATTQSGLDEICQILAKERGAIFAQPQAVAQDLDWLEGNGFLSPIPVHHDLELPLLEKLEAAAHPYSDVVAFDRLLKTIRFILHYPLNWSSDLGSLQSLVTGLKEAKILYGEVGDAIRKDIERTLKPFEILPSFPMRCGYFIGTAILSQQDLIQVLRVVEAQANSLQDPVIHHVYQRFSEAMRRAQVSTEKDYPIRAIANRTIVNTDYLPGSALAHTPHLQKLECAIEAAELLEVKRFKGSAAFGHEPQDFYCIWPLQIVFHDIAWYLGYEIAQGDQQGLLRFERLDRLFLGQPQNHTRSRREQEQALKRLTRLSSACASLYLGESVAQQRAFLSRDRQQRESVLVNLELWFNDSIFRFICEGTQRFPLEQMQMSERLFGSLREQPKLYCLPKSSDPNYPNVFQVKLPCWCLQDVVLRRWIIGFGDCVKVKNPPELIEQIQAVASSILQVYRD